MANTHATSPPASPPESAALMRALAAHPLEMAHLVHALHRRALDADMLLDLMGRIGREAVRLLPDVGWAGITAQFDGPPMTASHTDTRVLIVDERQYQAQDGPCLRATHTGMAVAMTATELSRVWPQLAQVARQVGVQAILALPLFANGRSVGALNLYSSRSLVPTPDLDLLIVLTEYAGRGLTDFQNSDPAPSADEVLRRTVADWVEVERAIEVLTRTYGFGVDWAREVLIDLAQDWGRTVSDQAAHVISDNPAPD
ncbi:ANTAR domain-containing protein [Nakamurella panacisegetis]|uniref:ANTAR domain-containing protein n=1 Tax=Nakamurella panacisegetis TaxID=1090615 RepID=A0A1H0RGQ4_9ACTN|nr:GAF domain-containing protein [Nakamurella panacisegetis]SDP28743.1 ANTAR domain-containing protein [Nakamurella panacisegetis]